MARKQLGMVDDALLDRVDAQAGILGQTRRVFVERALEAALDGSATSPQPREGYAMLATDQGPRTDA